MFQQKRLLKPSYLCIELQELGHLLAHSLILSSNEIYVTKKKKKSSRHIILYNLCIEYLNYELAMFRLILGLTSRFTNQ